MAPKKNSKNDYNKKRTGNGLTVSNDNNHFGSILKIVGILFVIISSMSDILGFGTNPQEFGILQIIGTLTGVILIIIGILANMFYKISS